MIKIPGTNIEVPNYAEKAALIRLESTAPITEEQRNKNLRCIAKLKAWLNGEVELKKKPKFTTEEKALTARDVLINGLIEG